MNEKKIKRLNVRISQSDYKFLKKDFLIANNLKPNYFKSFSEYIRYLIDLGLDDFYYK